VAGFLIRRDERALAVTVGGVEVASYVFDDPTCNHFEGPKPYLHPIRTLAGHVFTDFRPADHLWHKGLQMTLTDVSGQNFWGGNTYVDGEGYVALDNVGSIRHDSFDAITESEEATVEERLTWLTSAGAPWLSERRRLRFHGLDLADGVWALELTTRLTNIHANPLTLGSPATRGRVGVGYSGAFLRLAATFTGATVVTPGPVSHAGAHADRLMGATLPWLAFVSDDATVVALAGSSSGTPALRWFVRSLPEPVAAPSPTFDEAVVLAPGSDLTLSHRWIFADGALTPEATAALATRQV